MPTVRKMPAHEAATWDAPIDEEFLITETNIDDRTDLIRLDYLDHGSVGWSGRVYSGGKEYSHFFSDARYGGPEEAPRMAAAWRNAVRQRVLVASGQPRRRRGILRVDRPEWKNVGYFAWREGKRRYFSDARYSGPGGAKAAAQAWVEGSTT